MKLKNVIFILSIIIFCPKTYGQNSINSVPTNTSKSNEFKYAIINYDRNLINDSNIHLVRYLSNNQCIISYQFDSIPRILKYANYIKQLDGVEWKKLSSFNGSDQLMIKAYHHNRLKNIKGLRVLNEFKELNLYHIEFQTKSVIDELLELSEVYAISNESTDPENYLIALDNNQIPNKIRRAKFSYPHLQGQGQIISIKENMFDTTDLDLRNKSISSHSISSVISSHSTEMAKIIAGSGISFVLGEGVASKANLSSSDFNSIFPDSLNEFINIQNHSYGTDIENFYGALAQAYDEAVYNNPTKLHVFSSGNKGLEGSNENFYEDLYYRNISGNYKLSKNTLSVGALDTTYRLQAFSSRGPTNDGRVKPEIMAYSSVGTSNSAALVSGCATLVEQYFKEKYQHAPSASMQKAILINSADDLGKQGPDHQFGFGSLNCLKAIRQVEKGIVEDTLVANQEQRHEFYVGENSVNLKITIAWTDPSVEAYSERVLMNDLDMYLINPTGEIIRPWSLANKIDEGAARNIDSLNNVEQISLSFIESGSYQLVISSRSMISSKQVYSLAYSWESLDTFEWINPISDSNFPYDGKTTEYIRWESNLQSYNLGDFYYKYLHDNDWNLIKKDVELKKGFLRWKAPVKEGMAQIQLRLTDQVILSDTFTISYPLSIKSGFNCADSLELFFSPNSSVNHFKWWKLVENKWEIFKQTSDSSLIINKNNFDEQLIAVTAYQNNVPLIQSYATYFNSISTGCYVNSFYGIQENNEQIDLELNLNSTHQLKSIYLYKRGKERNELIQIINSPSLSSFSYQLTDFNPSNGINRYSVVLAFQDGTLSNDYFTEVEFVNDELGLFFFPNPLKSGEDLVIYSTPEIGDEASIQVLTLNGQAVMEKAVAGRPITLYQLRLQKGFYILRLIEGSSIYSAKLIVR